jgi:hypothetical protein
MPREAAQPKGIVDTGTVSIGGSNFNLPAQAASLLQKAFEALKEMGNVKPQQEGVGSVWGDKGKTAATPEVIEHLSTANPCQDIPESSYKAAARKEGGGKVAYCFRSKTKGHAIEECHAEMYCDICESRDHIRPRCPKFRAAKQAAVPCGYAVEGLGFFHIAHDAIHKHKKDDRAALIKITDGVLTIPNVISELERSIPGGWTWNVEATGNNTIKTIFPSRAELHRMVEWGVVHTKIQNAKLQIEERLVDNEVKYTLPKVWVQFIGLPHHLHDYLIIWAVGSILGVIKEVDMVFTRRFEVSRLQVMVINPNLIPEVVNVVIGDNLHELKFHVEHQMDSSNPQPMELDNDHYADEGERQMGNKQGANSMNNSNSNTAARKSGDQRERGKDHSRVSEIK